MEIKRQDLRYIFIRVYRDREWQNIDLGEATDLEFKDWIADRLTNTGYTPNQIELDYSLTPQKRVDTLNELQPLGFKARMINRKRRKEFDKCHYRIII